MPSRSVAAAYTGAILIAVVGIALSIAVFLQTLHGPRPQSTRPSPSPSSSVHALPKTGPTARPQAGGGLGARGGSGTSGVGGGPVSLSHPTGVPPADVEDDTWPTPAPAGPLAGAVAPALSPVPVLLPSVAPPPLP